MVRYKWAIVLAAVVAAPLEAQSIDPNAFRVPIFNGPRHAPDFSGPAHKELMFRTTIRNGFMSGPVAAGHYALMSAGCGMQCVIYWFGDLRTGKIINFPIGGEYFPELQLTTAPDTKLIIARWGSSLDNKCTMRVYAFEQGTFKQIGLDRSKSSSCDSSGR